MKSSLVHPRAFHENFDGAALTGTGVADVHAFAFEIHKVFDARVGTGDHRKRLRMHGEDRPQILVGPRISELARTGECIILHVGLGHAHVQLAASDGVEVVNGAAGALHRAADAMLFSALVDQTRNGAARGIIHAGDTAGTDGDEGGFRLRRSGTEANHE